MGCRGTEEACSKQEMQPTATGTNMLAEYRALGLTGMLLPRCKEIVFTISWPAMLGEFAFLR